MSLSDIINKVEKFYSQLDVIIYNNKKKNELLILDYFCNIAVTSGKILNYHVWLPKDWIILYSYLATEHTYDKNMVVWIRYNRIYTKFCFDIICVHSDVHTNLFHVINWII